MNKTILNTLKIASAAIVAIIIAKVLNLDNGISAGIVAILSIQATKKETIKTALERFMAFVCALAISFVTYHICGYNLIGFCLYLIGFIYVCQRYQWIAAMAMDSVLISHFIGFQSMATPHMINEALIFFIGIGAGILANMHLRADVNYIEELKTNADEQIKKILHRMSEHMLKEDKSDYNNDCFLRLDDMIREAENVAKINYENQLGKKDEYDLFYIQMRKNQKDVLHEMYKLIRQVKTTPDTIHIIANFLEEISLQFEASNTVEDLLEKTQFIDQFMASTELPQTRKEFEDRALLFTLLKKIKEFLDIKAEFAAMIKKHEEILQGIKAFKS
ncbi:MAG: hypothetical protein J6P61_09725 [Erysipelotrichaceae bacterium]|nr:hypothetical protein [Erysipelotrichaceae bacterium]